MFRPVPVLRLRFRFASLLARLPAFGSLGCRFPEKRVIMGREDREEHQPEQGDEKLGAVCCDPQYLYKQGQCQKLPA